MVTQWGFSDRLGPLFYEMDDNSSYGRPKDISDETARIIDEEVKKIIDRNFERARKILTENMDVLHAMKDALMKYETIGAKQVADLIARRPITAPEDWTESDEQAAKEIPNEGTDIPPQSEN